MEERAIIREKHGIANARKIASVSVEDSATQSVTVTDGGGEVRLSLSTASFPAGLTPEQARFIAAQLEASAARVEAAEP